MLPWGLLTVTLCPKLATNHFQLFVSFPNELIVYLLLYSLDLLLSLCLPSVWDIVPANAFPSTECATLVWMIVPTAYHGVLSPSQPVGDLVPKSHLRDCFLGPTVLDQRFACRSFTEECAQQQNLWGNEGSELSREKWSYSALVTQTSAMPTGSSATRSAFQTCPQMWKGDWPLYSCVTNHWICLRHKLGQGSLCESLRGMQLWTISNQHWPFGGMRFLVQKCGPGCYITSSFALRNWRIFF